VAIGLLFVSALTGAPALAITSAGIAPSLSPDRLGARAALTMKIRYGGGELGVPSPVLTSVVRLPVGMNLDVPSLHSCTAARLLARGASGCPRQSRLGGGHALVETLAGSQTVTENVTLSVFLGPPDNLDPTFDVLAQGDTPVDETLVLGGSVRTDSAPYGERLVMSIPPVPALPAEPDVSLESLTLTVGSAPTHAHTNAASILVPRSCPAGGFPFAAEFTYIDGSHSNISTTIPCPR
jgi:hypothetical protein